MNNEVKKQREYYKQTACDYDAACVFDSNDEHFIGAAALSGFIKHYNINSLLDVGCGTGRSLMYLRERHPELQLKGVEPVAALREIAVCKGLLEYDLQDGDACSLDFPDSSIDCVTAFGVLHHIPNPAQAIREMKRVARKAIFISDHNVYGMGSFLTKAIKQGFRDLGLRKMLNLILTRGKGYHDTNWDGVFYPFSLLDHMELIKNGMKQTFTISTKGPAINFYREASHVAVFAIKKTD
jgi:ubiquinone/menaquinone biosynthesis C-methylase UbiE